MGAARHVEVDARRRDRAREDVERHVADLPRIAGVAAEVAAAEGEVDLGRGPARLAHHRRRPLLPELVAVAVEEDVHLLRDRLRREELRVGAPEDRLGPAGAELEQARQPALRVREHEVVLRRVGAVVVVEAGVHAAELGQAHRHVAVVEDDRDPEPLAQRRRDAAEVRHRHGEEDDRIGALPLDEPLEMAPPARRHDAPDRLARDAVERRLLRLVLRPAQVAVALEPRQAAADGGVRLALAVGRVRRRPPPGRLDRAAAVRRDDEVDAGLVHPLPELPPGGRAAVAEVEVDGGRDGEDLRWLHDDQSRATACRHPPSKSPPRAPTGCRVPHRASGPAVVAPAQYAPRPREHGRDRLRDDRDVEPDRPVLEVREVESHEIVERETRPAGDLPEAGHAGEDEIACPVPVLEQLVVAERQRPRADEAHLPTQRR